MASFQWQSKRLVVAIVLGKRDPEDTNNEDLAGFVSVGSGDYTPAPQLSVLWDEEDDTPSEFRFSFAGVEG